MKNTRSGFSLVELMVVVAIIGILATIAVPNFQRFQAKAKQSNAKVELSGVYTAEKAFFTEYSSYHSNLYGIGFVPEGFDTTSGAMKNQTQRYYATAAGANATTGTWPAQLPTPSVAAYVWGASSTQCATYGVAQGGTAWAAPKTAPSAAAGGGMVAGPTATNTGFVAVSAGCPRNPAQSSAQADVWAIDENKSLRNVQSGI